MYNSGMTARARIAADLAAICKRLDDGDPHPGDEEQLRAYKELPTPVRAQVMRAAEMIYPLAAQRLRTPEEPEPADDAAQPR